MSIEINRVRRSTPAECYVRGMRNGATNLGSKLYTPASRYV